MPLEKKHFYRLRFYLAQFPGVQRRYGTRRVASSALEAAWLSAALFCLFLLSSPCSIAQAAPGYRLSKGQTLYVPVYSNIFSGPKKLQYNLATILSIRNTDLSNAITVLSADYYDSKGKLVRNYYQKPVTLSPLESTDIFIPEEDTTGGTGANFIVRWSSLKEVNAPIVESVMFGMKSGQGISFVSPSQEIKPRVGN